MTKFEESGYSSGHNLLRCLPRSCCQFRMLGGLLLHNPLWRLSRGIRLAIIGASTIAPMTTSKLTAVLST